VISAAGPTAGIINLRLLQILIIQKVYYLIIWTSLCICIIIDKMCSAVAFPPTEKHFHSPGK